LFSAIKRRITQSGRKAYNAYFIIDSEIRRQLVDWSNPSRTSVECSFEGELTNH